MATRAFEKSFVGIRGGIRGGNRPRETLGVMSAFEPTPCGSCKCDIEIKGKTLFYGSSGVFDFLGG